MRFPAHNFGGTNHIQTVGDEWATSLYHNLTKVFWGKVLQQAGLKTITFISNPPNYWHHRYVPLCPVNFQVFRFGMLNLWYSDPIRSHHLVAEQPFQFVKVYSVIHQTKWIYFWDSISILIMCDYQIIAAQMVFILYGFKNNDKEKLTYSVKFKSHIFSFWSWLNLRIWNTDMRVHCTCLY